MTTKDAIHFGPRLVGIANRNAARRGARSSDRRASRTRRTLPGEPGAVYSRALEQHEILRKTLEYFGVETVAFEPRGGDPYESAIADAAVAFEDGALIMRPSAMARRSEADRMQSEFAQLDVPLAGHIAPPGLSNGSDVMLAGATAFVGVGARGNAIGRAGFAKVAQRPRLSRRRSWPRRDRAEPARRCERRCERHVVVLAKEKVDLDAFAGFNTIVLDRGEDMAAGVLCIGERHVIADVRYRTSLARMRKAGITVEGIDLYDFEKIGITPSLLVLALKRD